MAFVCHCHVHDEFSPLDGKGNRNQLTYEAVRKGQTHLGFTNHGRLGGALEHVHACRHPEKYDNPLDPSKKRSKDERLHPILAIEAFWRPNRFMDLSDTEVYGKNGHNWAQHLCLHARNLAGWRTLMRLSSKSWVRTENGGGFYGKPCMDWEMIEQDHEGIIVSTACMSSPLSQLILQGYEDEAKQWCVDMIDIVGERNFFFEVMPHDLDQQREINIAKINIANELGMPYMASGDVHAPYLKWIEEDEEGANTHEVVWMIATRSTVSKREAQKEAGEEIYGEACDTIFLSGEDEMYDMFERYHPDMSGDMIQEALDNTEAFIKRFTPYVIGKATKLPKITATDDEAEDTLWTWCQEGLKRISKHKTPSYIERLDYEFGVLKGKGVLDYFMLVGDLIRWCKSDEPLPPAKDDPKPKKKRPIRVGLGRGSAAGCLVSYLIGITGIDPIAWGLLFERFLNPDRVGLPDIDLDFETEVTIMTINGVDMDGREMAKEYLRRKIGHDHVADIIAYQTFAPRAVIKDVGDVFELPFKELEKVTESIGDTERGLEKIAATNPIVAKFRDDHPWIWEQCLRLEDQIRRDSRHAGGVLITPKPVNYYVPTQLGNDEKSVVTAWSDRAEFPIVSDYGFVKLDALGVKGLGKQELCCQLIRDHYEIDFEPNDLPVLRDPYDTEQKVIDAFVHGMTVGVFQFGGGGITSLLRHIKPTSAIDIAVANALYRPGPINEAFKYGDRKNGKVPESEWYWSDAVEPLLRETYGIIAFQEQVMEITKVLGNFTGGEADSMRKAISKLYRLPGDKAREFMQGFYDRWMKGCAKNGISEHDANVIWAAILEFAGYGFNKSHSASYALQAYQDMHMKIHFPLAFYAATLTIEKKQKRAEQEQFIKSALREARVLGVEALPPDVNRSDNGWTIDFNNIRYGLVSVSGMGSGTASVVKENRPFATMPSYFEQMPSDFSVGATVALGKAGAFDELEERDFLLGQVRRLPPGVTKLKVKMDCGHNKTKTVKLKPDEMDGLSDDELDALLDEKVEEALEELVCKHHPNAKVEKYEEEDSHYTVLEYVKDNGNEWPDEVDEKPSEIELLDYEVDTLHISLSQAKLVARYHEFIAERIHSEEEIEEVPAKPDRKKVKGKWVHSGRCSCADCKAAEVRVGGEITNTKVIKTKGGDLMAFADVAFGVSTYNLTFFPYYFEKFGKYLDLPGAFFFNGHKDKKGGIMVYDMGDAIETAKQEGWEPPENVVQMPRRMPKPKVAGKRKKINKLKKRKVAA